jgi:hypothetical protein
MTLHPIPINFLIYEENFLFFFISVASHLLRDFRENFRFNPTQEYNNMCGYIRSLRRLPLLSCLPGLGHFPHAQRGKQQLLHVGEGRLKQQHQDQRHTATHHEVGDSHVRHTQV